VKTTVEIPDDLLIRAKKRAAETRTTLRVLIARGLRRELAERGTQGGTRGRRTGIRWVTAAGGLPPGLDVADRGALHAWKESQR
jgi:hypothetical protein